MKRVKFVMVEVVKVGVDMNENEVGELFEIEVKNFLKEIKGDVEEVVKICIVKRCKLVSLCLRQNIESFYIREKRIFCMLI